jgi:hypothetical protein
VQRYEGLRGSVLMSFFAKFVSKAADTAIQRLVQLHFEGWLNDNSQSHGAAGGPARFK